MNRSRSMSSLKLLDLGDPTAALGSEKLRLGSSDGLARKSTSRDRVVNLSQQPDIDSLIDSSPGGLYAEHCKSGKLHFYDPSKEAIQKKQLGSFENSNSYASQEHYSEESIPHVSLTPTNASSEENVALSSNRSSPFERRDIVNNIVSQLVETVVSEETTLEAKTVPVSFTQQADASGLMIKSDIDVTEAVFGKRPVFDEKCSLEEVKIEENDIPEEPSPLPPEINFEGVAPTSSVPVNGASCLGEDEVSCASYVSYGSISVCPETSHCSAEFDHCSFEKLPMSSCDISQIYQQNSDQRASEEHPLYDLAENGGPHSTAHGGIILRLAPELGALSGSMNDENWQPDVDSKNSQAEVKEVCVFLPKKQENVAKEQDRDLTPPLIPCHRRFRSDNTGVGPSSSKNTVLLKRQSSGGDSSTDQIGEEGSPVGSRCKSQLFLRDNLAYDGTDAKQEEFTSRKALSTSSPSVNEAEREIVAKVLRIGVNNDGTQKEAKNWSNYMPSAFGAHQVIGPLQRPAKLGALGGSIVETSRPHKLKLEKKIRKSSGLFDLFPSVRKKPQNVQKSGIRLSETSRPIDRRVTMTEDSSISGLPGELVRVLRNDRPMTIGVSEGRHWVAQLRDEPDFIPQINKPKWSDLELWASEPSSWSSQHPNLKVSKQERKKQDVIYELYLTEKHYCQVLVILQQVYQEGLRVRQILPDDKRNELIPAVLDALLDFHLNLLRKLRIRRNESVVVGGVSDIILSEFEFGDKNRAAIFAYTEICSKKEFCGRLYDIYRVRNFEVRKFFDEFEKNPIFKDRTFKMCLLIVAQRLTKYPVLLDQILKLEPQAGKEICSKAVQAVKRFAEHVDSELNKIEMIRRWDRIRSQISRSSIGRHNQKVSFTYADLILEDGQDQRKVLRVGDATCYSNPSNFKNEDGAEVKLVLFDDILVLLSRAQGKSGFVFHDRGPSGCSVIKVKTMIVRDVPRKELMLFIIARNHPASDLIPVEFLSKKEFLEWRKVLEEAIQNAPSFVRRAPGTEGELQWERQEECDEATFNDQVDRWDSRLLDLFEQRKAAEDELALFIERRMRWFEELNNHLMHIPIKKHRDAQKIPQIPEKVKATVKRKFDELRTTRFSALSKVMEKVQKASEEQFLTYFDDQHDVSVWSSDVDSPESCRSTISESRLRYIRRTQTFNGADVERNVIIRRHTTEPMLSENNLTESEKAAVRSNERLRRLSMTLAPSVVRNLAHVVEECVDVRIENMKLRDDIALMALQLAVFKTRPAATAYSTLEVLRNKQNKLQEEKDAFNVLRENLYADIKKKEDEIAEKEKNLQASEEQLEEKWKTFLEASTSPTTSTDGLTRYRPLSSSRSSTSASFRPLSMHNISAMPRVLQPNPLSKSPSGSSMPLHLAEKTILSRNKKS